MSEITEGFLEGELEDAPILQARNAQVEAALAELFFAVRQNRTDFLEYAMMRAGAVVRDVRDTPARTLERGEHMSDKLHESIAFDRPRVGLKGASDLPDTVPGGLKMGDRISIRVVGNVVERKQIVRPNGQVDWVKVIEVDASFDLEVLNRISDELPFPGQPVDLNNSVTISGNTFAEPLTVDSETGEVIDSPAEVSGSGGFGAAPATIAGGE